MQQKNILAVCNCGIATSSVVVIKVKEFAEKHGIKVSVDKCMLGEYASKIKLNHYDLIVSTSRVPDLGVPIINGMSFLTGIGLDMLEKNIIHVLQDETKSV